MTNEMMVLYPLFFWLGLAFCLMLAYAVLGPSRSKLYRQSLADMYVAGKIKQIAKKEGLDLNEEFLEFAKITKNKRIDMEALDTTVERELQEKITESNKAMATKPKDKK